MTALQSSAAILALLLLLSPVAFAWFVSGFLVHAPDELPPGVVPEGWENADPRSLYGLDFEDLSFSTEDGVEVGAWLIPAASPDPQRAVVFVHGRGGSRGLVLGILDELHAAGFSVLSLDTRGHGTTPEPTPGAAFLTGWQDVSAAVSFLRKQRGFAQVGVFGVSQGAASAMLAAARTGGVDALLEQSGATSLFGLMRGLPVLGWLPDWEISLICSLALYRMEAASNIVRSPRSGLVEELAGISPTPLFVVHGDSDELVAVSEAHALFEAAAEPKELWIVAGRGHVDIGADEDYSRRVVAFFSQHLQAPGNR